MVLSDLLICLNHGQYYQAYYYSVVSIDRLVCMCIISLNCEYDVYKIILSLFSDKLGLRSIFCQHFVLSVCLRLCYLPFVIESGQMQGFFLLKKITN